MDNEGRADMEEGVSRNNIHMYMYVGVNYVVSNTMYVHIHVHVGYRFLSTTLAYLGLPWLFGCYIH